MADQEKMSTSDIAQTWETSREDRTMDKGRVTTEDARSVDDARKAGDTRSAEDARRSDAIGEGGAATRAQNGESDDGERTVLFDDRETEELRDRWSDVQAGFVDRPKESVEEADSLVAETMKRLAEGFSEERTALESAWSKGEQASTEDLRVAMRRYRSFFERLLSA